MAEKEMNVANECDRLVESIEFANKDGIKAALQIATAHGKNFAIDPCRRQSWKFIARLMRAELKRYA